MDLGMFRRSRTAFTGWIILPLVLVCVAFYLVHVYCSAVEQGLKRRRDFLDVLPDMQRRLTVSEDIVNGFALTGQGNGEAIDVLGAQVHSMARRHDFVINSLRIDKLADQSTEEILVLEIAIKGEGVLLELIRFLNDLQRPQTLALLEECRLQVSKVSADPVYDVEMTLRCHCIAM